MVGSWFSLRQHKPALLIPKPVLAASNLLAAAPKPQTPRAMMPGLGMTISCRLKLQPTMDGRVCSVVTALCDRCP
jgi:hypothetical protein